MTIEFERKAPDVEPEQVKMDFQFSHTDRGFALIDFQDDNDQICSIQKSSAADEDLVWVGQGKDRMHLSQERAAVVGAILLLFAQGGELPGEQEATEMCAKLFHTEPEWTG